MRIHTNLTHDDLYRVVALSGAPISFHNSSEHGSRTRDRAFEIALNGTGGLNNTGLYGSGDRNGATWDEWGAFFGALYSMDPTAVCGGTAKRPHYRNSEHFHHVTGHRFEGRKVEPGACDCGVKYGRAPKGELSGHFPGCSTAKTLDFLPLDTHPRHRWEFVGTYGVADGPTDWVCTHKAGCTATRPGHNNTIGA